MQLVSYARAVQVLRITISLFMTTHGLARLFLETVPDFGAFLDAEGFPKGEIFAWALTFFEISFGILLAAGFLKKLACLFFIIELLMGIGLVHAGKGWFVVGANTGGMEYNVLLVIGFLLVALTAKENEEHDNYE